MRPPRKATEPYSSDELYRHQGKRLLDALLAAGGILIFLLPMAAIGGWILFGCRRPPFFRQLRIGLEGKSFGILKFRTLSETKTVLPFTGWLRATALDELPQLFQILTGQMSFVGPRPLIPEELKELDRIPEGFRRARVRPGLSGLAQIRAAKSPSLSERLRWDLEYMERCSLPLDLWILMRSAAITLRGAWEKR